MRFVAKTLYGLEKVLSEELISLGAVNVQIANRAVLFEGDKESFIQCKLLCQNSTVSTGAIADFRIRSKDDLYKGGSKIEWDKFMDPMIPFPLFL